MKKISITITGAFPRNNEKKITGNTGVAAHSKLILAFVFCILSLDMYAQKPVIINFGWDYPDVGQMSKRMDSMQNTPFNGICFSLQRNIMEAFDTVAKNDAYFEADKLNSLKWGRYTDNFIIMRGYSKTGGNWFSDKAWTAITSNLNGVSKAMLAGKLKGILFDAEYYYTDTLYNPWTYSHAQYPNSSFEEVQNKVRDRGTQFVKALQKSTDDFSFLSIWLTSMIAEDKKKMPVERTRQALLPSFIEGMLLGKSEKVKIVDGNENGYWFSRPSQFVESVAYLKKNTVELMRSDKAKQLAQDIQTSQPIFYDGILARHSSFERGFETADKWRWLEENLKYAIATSTSNIVWFYYQRVNWWKDNVNDTLVSILQNASPAFTPGMSARSAAPKKLLQPKLNNVNTGKAYFYLYDAKKPMSTGDSAFTYSLDTKNKLLILKYGAKIPASVSVYINNILATTITPKGPDDTIKLSNLSSGKLAVIAKYKDNFEAAGLEQVQ